MFVLDLIGAFFIPVCFLKAFQWGVALIQLVRWCPPCQVNSPHFRQYPATATLACSRKSGKCELQDRQMPDFSKVPFNILNDSEFVPFSTHNAGEVTLAKWWRKRTVLGEYFCILFLILKFRCISLSPIFTWKLFFIVTHLSSHYRSAPQMVITCGQRINEEKKWLLSSYV